MMSFTRARMLLTITLLMSTLTVASAYIVAPASAQVDDWPMFKHDPAHTGYSTSSAPAPFIVGWKYKTGDSVRSSPAVVAGKVYVGCDDTYVYCLDAASGSFVWKYKTEHAVISSPAVVGGKVYVGGYDTYVYCLDAASGSLVWKYKTGKTVYSSPCVVDGKVYIASSDGQLYCLDANAGTLVWNFTIADWSVIGYYVASPAVVDGKVYIGSFNMYVYCLDAASGSLVWESKLGAPVYASSPLVAYGKVWVGADDTHLYCLDAASGTLLLSYRSPENISPSATVESTPAAAYGKVYVGFPHALECFNPTTFERLWFGRTGSAQKSSPAVADDKVYIGGQDSYFWCYDAASGEQLQNMGKFAGAFQSSPTIYDGKIYIGSWDNNVYCFVSGSPTVISCWSDPSSMTIGDTVWTRGAIDPVISGATVTLTYMRPDATTLNRTVTSATDGTYEDSYTPDAEGQWSVKASWPGSATHGGSVSTATAYVSPAVFSVMPVAKVSTTINCWLGWSTSLPLGETQYTRGGICPAVSGATVALTYTKPDATTVERTVTSATDGTYEDPYEPDAEGVWSVKASWPGSATHEGSTSTVAAFSVAEEAAVEEEGIPMTYIYLIIGLIVVVIAVVAIVAIMLMRKK